MLSSEVVESNVQYASVWKVFAGDNPQADLLDQPGLAVCWGHSPFPFWNALFLTEQLTSADTLRSRVRAAAAYLRAQPEDGLLYICEEYLTGAARSALPAAIAGEGLEFALPITGMVGDILPVADKRPAGLRFQRANTDMVLRDYADMNSLGYGFPLAAGRAGLVGSRLWREDLFAFVGYVDDQPVSAAAILVHDQLLYLALVATHPDWQRRGFGEATVRQALSAAHQATGLRRTLLHATDAGAPVYARVGYHPTMKMMTYKPKQ